MAPKPPQKINIPGSTVYIVDADGNGKFGETACIDSQPDTKLDYYEQDGKPICPDSEMVSRALGNIGLFTLMQANKMTDLKDLLNAAYNFKYGQDEKTRQEALQTLAAIPVVKYLFTESFDSPQYEVRVIAKQALELIASKGNTNAGDTVVSLVYGLCGPRRLENVDGRGEAASLVIGLTDLYGGDVISFLVYTLDYRIEGDPECRQIAVSALALIGPPDANGAVGTLIGALHDPNVGVRCGACFALGLIGAPARWAFSGLVERLKADGLDSVRAEAATALGNIGLGLDITDYIRVAIIEELQRAAKNDPSEDVRKAATDALKKLQGKK